jgi:U3 small nucleolar RNA-associated protein 10
LCYPRVNELNVHDLVLCALPFHATNEFVRLVQTLSFKGTPWEWLTPMQASGAAMPRSVLVTRCGSDPVVLSSICKAAEAMGAPRCLSRTFLSTYAVTVCEVLMAASPEVPEQLLRQLVPFLVAGLRRSASLDYRAATLMIVTQLCSVAQLGPEVLAGEETWTHLLLGVVVVWGFWGWGLSPGHNSSSALPRARV